MPEHAAPTFVERVRGVAARGIGRLPSGVLARLAGSPVDIDGQRLDPMLQFTLGLRPKRGAAPLTVGDPAAARARFRREILSVQGNPTPVAAVRDLQVDGADGPLDARLYSPADAPADAPLLVFYHGGGYTLGDLDTHDEPCRLLCRYGAQHVLSVAYRLAPEHPFPAPDDDTFAAFRWAQAHAAEIGASGVAVGGDSAGANLAAGVAQRSADDRSPTGQLLFYPPTDETATYPSHTLFDGYFLSREDKRAFAERYYGADDALRRDPRISPLLGARAGLAPALVVTAGFDVLRDEGRSLRRRARSRRCSLRAPPRGWARARVYPPHRHQRRHARGCGVRRRAVASLPWCRMKIDLRQAVIVVTGAASGIGRATALALADAGAALALADRNAEGLAETVAEARGRGVEVSMHVLDVTEAAAVAALPGAVLDAHGRATVLVNNAGVSLAGRFEEVSMEEFRWLMEVNFFATVGLTKAFLPLLQRQEAAQIVNVSSLFGLIAPAEQVAYAASKFAVRGFSEALRHELEETPVGVTVVHPGGIRTAIARSARIAAGADAEAARAEAAAFERVFLRRPPEAAGEAIADAIARRRKRLLIGADARGGDALQRLLPSHYWAFLRRGFERLKEPQR